MSAPSWSRVARLAAVLAALLAAPASAQSFGTLTTSLSHSWDAWFWGNYNVYNDCNQGAKACGPGPQSSTTPHSFSSGTTMLGSGSGSAGANGGYGGAGGLSPNYWESEGSLESTWWDSFTVNSLSLPPGTAIDINLAILFTGHGSGLASSWWSGACMSYGGPSNGLFGARLGYQGAAGNALSGLYTFTLHQRVGSTFKLFGTTKVSVGSTASTGYIPPTGASNAADAQALFYVDVDPQWSGVSLTTASGQGYGTPSTTVAPEPASFALVLTGLGACVVARRRRRER